MTKFYVQTRRNDTLAIVDPQVDDFEKFEAVLRFKSEGTWQMSMRMESSHAAQFLPQSSTSGGYPYGIVLIQDNEDGSAPFIVMSGPHRRTQRQVTQEDTQPLIASGFSDLVYLKDRLALPMPMRPYAYYLGSLAAADAIGATNSWYTTTGTLQRLYKLNEASGTVATDLSGNAVNGTYAGSVSLGQPGLVDDPVTSVKFDGATTEVQVPTTGLPTVNSSFTVWAWGLLTANPSGTVYLWSHGTNAAKQGVAMGVTSAGLPIIVVAGGGGSQTGATAVPLNVPFFLSMTWDSTTLTGYLNGVSFGSFVPGALNIAYGFARIGDFLGASGFWPGRAAFCGMNSAIFPAATHLTMYQVGASRQAYLGFDNLGFQPTISAQAVAFASASEAIFWYVQRNASTNQVPQFNGVASPVARQVPHLVLPATDPAIGSLLYGAARFDNLLVLIQALALQSSPELGFSLLQSGSQLQFNVFVPTDRTATAIFSREVGNILESEWDIASSEGNHLFAGGLNPTTNLNSRTFGEGEDALGVTRFGRIESFLDFRKTTDTNALVAALNGKLAELAAKRNVNVTAIDTPGLSFGGPGNKGYNLGDKVTVILDGITFTDIIREVKITLEPGRPAVITPAIGTPVDGAIISELDMMFKRLRGNDAAFTLIQGNY